MRKAKRIDPPIGGKQVSPTFYRPVPNLGVVTFWLIGGGVAFNVLCHEIECAADEIRLSFEEVERLLQSNSEIQVTRVIFKHRKRRVAVHYLRDSHEDACLQAVRDGVHCVMEHYMLPLRIVRQALDQLVRR